MLHGWQLPQDAYMTFLLSDKVRHARSFLLILREQGITLNPRQADVGLEGAAALTSTLEQRPIHSSTEIRLSFAVLTEPCQGHICSIKNLFPGNIIPHLSMGMEIKSVTLTAF